MSSVLGLYIGIQQIGYAWIETSGRGQAGEIAGLGARMVPLPTDDAIDFRLGRSLSSYRHRRIRRNLRVQYRRYKARRNQVNKLLADSGLTPSADVTTLSGVELWSLRARAATDILPLPHLARVMQHVSRKRGFLPATDTKPTNGTLYRHLEQNEQALQEEGLTIGQYISRRMQAEPHFAPKSLRFYRHTHRAEFEIIWATHQRAYPHLLTDELKMQLADQTLYYQRPPKPRPPWERPCRFEHHHLATPASNPLYGLFKTATQLSKLTLIELKTGEVRPLRREEREQLLTVLAQTDTLNRNGILDTLDLDPYAYESSFERLKGNETGSVLYAVLREWVNASGTRGRGITARLKPYQSAFQLHYRINPDGRIALDEQNGLFALWHVLYANAGSPTLVQTLSRHFGFPESLSSRLAGITFSKRRSHLSSRAIRRLLPSMLEGATVEEAIRQVGYAPSGQSQQKPAEAHNDGLSLFRPNELGNPVIEKVFNQALNLLRTILHHPGYGPPDVLRIQLATEFRHPAAKRQQYREQLQKNRNENERVRQFLRQHFSIDHPPADLFGRTLVYLQQAGVDLLTGEPLPVQSVLETRDYPLHPIQPNPANEDHSLNNRILTTRKASSWLKCISIMAYFDRRSRTDRAAYLNRCHELYGRRLISPAKWKLMTTADDIRTVYATWERHENTVTRTLLQKLARLGCTIEQTYPSQTRRLRKHWNALSPLANIMTWERDQFTPTR